MGNFFVKEYPVNPPPSDSPKGQGGSVPKPNFARLKVEILDTKQDCNCFVDVRLPNGQIVNVHKNLVDGVDFET